MIIVQGISWITEKNFGSYYKNFSGNLENSRDLYNHLQSQGILQQKIKNFGRFNKVSTHTCLAIAMALHDADVSSSKNNMQNTGILSTNQQGCLNANINYFQDYVESGRKLSRGNLFVYTLSSTPIAEASIIFGCQGLNAYYTFKEYQTQALLEQGRLLLKQKEVKDLLIVNANEKQAICFLLSEDSNANNDQQVSFETIQREIQGIQNISDIIRAISKKGNQ